MNNQLKISAIIPCFNSSLYLKNCLLSLVKQTFHDFKVIIVDDGSTDSTKDVCFSFKNKLDIDYIYQKNQGPSVARNTGIKKANSQFVVFIDSDDTVEPEYLGILYYLITKYKTMIAFIASEIPLFGNFEKNTEKVISFTPSNLADIPTLFPVWTGIYNVNLFTKHLFNPNLKNLYEDYTFIFECLCDVKNVALYSRYLYNYSFTPESLSRRINDFDKKIDDLFISRVTLINYLIKNNEIVALKKMLKHLLNSLFDYYKNGLKYRFDFSRENMILKTKSLFKFKKYFNFSLYIKICFFLIIQNLNLKKH